jgi:hypothetical protein
VALGTDWGAKNAAVAQRRVFVDLMATQAGDRLIAVDCHIADISPDVTISGIELWVIGPGKINFEVLEKIVTGDKVVWVGSTGRA